ncbi:Oxoglutarate/iron-dependent dioxygenase [uncultured Caudovirales phage]|uniref:Oxoglutarate/iron-dependent dioxygenase n=1 Tax=uncultured Caudovirales phage TaxID=2100421 RepID=A0A6J7WS12_9CAUD|nr:Oxoglutarate/iron-dependent dioxygenase [uncultured Caudovirales phage]
MTEWHDLPRSEKEKTRLEPIDIGNGITCINLGYGINLYRNAIPREQGKKIIETLESTLADTSNNFEWHGAMVRDNEIIEESRNCVDFKYKREHIDVNQPGAQGIIGIHKDVEDKLDLCLRHYESLWHLKMHYKEAFNFVKYNPGKYFKVHSDDGPYYTCTISSVVYLNDDYEGGEIAYPRHDLVIKPEAGDILINPSTFVYEHASLEVKSGQKYAVVIMNDYNDMFHKEHS